MNLFIRMHLFLTPNRLIGEDKFSVLLNKIYFKSSLNVAIHGWTKVLDCINKFISCFERLIWKKGFIYAAQSSNVQALSHITEMFGYIWSLGNLSIYQD